MVKNQVLSGLGGAIIGAAFLVAAISQARAGNIITFDDNANSCGGSVMCSTNGTTGYVINGTGMAFDLSTINSWFQIDVDGTNHLTSTQTSAEPDQGAGGFRVTNDTGSTVTTFSLTLTDTFNSSTAGDQTCGSSPCQQFQAQQGAGAPSGTESLSGSDIFSCSTATLVGSTCNSSGANATALFAPNSVTYTWSGLNISAGSTFDISFASWPGPTNANDALPPVPVTTPEPASLALFGSALAGFGFVFRRRRRG
jgi:hypothetical protein